MVKTVFISLLTFLGKRKKKCLPDELEEARMTRREKKGWSDRRRERKDPGTQNGRHGLILGPQTTNREDPKRCIIGIQKRGDNRAKSTPPLNNRGARPIGRKNQGSPV